MDIRVDTQALTISWDDTQHGCRIGRGGAVGAAHKVEGDGATPLGAFALRFGLYRPDRLPKPRSALTLHPITAGDLWCDDAGHTAYNRWVGAPFAGAHEILMREDIAYDMVLVIGHNDEPPVPGRGSAVFIHLDRPDHRNTLGCVALEPDAMIALLRDAVPGDTVTIV